MAIIIVIVVIIVGFIAFDYLNSPHKEGSSYNSTLLANSLSIDMANWNYDSKNDVYYQLGITYCLNPDSSDYETLAIYVPGKYFDGVKNDNGTYTCKKTSNSVGNYTADNAPIVMPINTPGYSAQNPQKSYSLNDAKEYLDSGYVYVYAGCHGRDNGDNYTGGAPWGVVDLKASILYLKFNGEDIAGDTNRIFTFGHSGGGAQSAIVGASGNSELYDPYLESIGAALVDKSGHILNDDVCGVMCWCPITSLDYANEAYEWNLGQYSNTGTRSNATWTSSLSDDLASEYASYINDLNLKSPDGIALKLEKSENGIYTSGTYYDYLMGVVETSLNNFLNDTEFPYSPSSNEMGEMSGAPSGDVVGGSDLPSDGLGDVVGGGDLPSDGLGDGNLPSKDADNMKSSSLEGEEIATSDSLTYNTTQDYIDSLNENETWVEYDSSTNTAKIISMEAFVKHCKNPTKSVGAFDSLNKTEAENSVFGNGENNELHFDSVMADLLKNNSDKYSKYSDFNSNYSQSYIDDISSVDALNNSIETRINMYNPMYYLCDYYDGYQTSDIAKYWRINSGIEQGDTAITVETNLALALNQSDNVETVDFETVWQQGHTQAERTGDSTGNFIDWVNKCLN